MSAGSSELCIAVRLDMRKDSMAMRASVPGRWPTRRTYLQGAALTGVAAAACRPLGRPAPAVPQAVSFPAEIIGVIPALMWVWTAFASLYAAITVRQVRSGEWT